MKKMFAFIGMFLFGFYSQLIAQQKNVAGGIVATSRQKTFPLNFGKLNDFLTKGLPSPAPGLTSGRTLEITAAIMATKIVKFDDSSLSVLITAVQTAGFFIIDENRKILHKPTEGTSGQGLAFYDFELVGALKLDEQGYTTSLDKIASAITRNTSVAPQLFADLLLKDLREQVYNDSNVYLRFWARLIVELGYFSQHPVNLMTAQPNEVTLSILQASLLMRRITGHFLALEETKKLGTNSAPDILMRVSAGPNAKNLSPISFNPNQLKDCTLSETDALVLDAAANVVTSLHGVLFDHLDEAIGSEALTTFKNSLFFLNLVFAWAKLWFAVVTIRGEITVEGSLPLIRTMNSVPGEKRLMKAKVWSEVGKKELLNCLRTAINVATGMDFSLPSEGPLGGVGIEWHFAGDNGAVTAFRYATFEAPVGKDRNPSKQISDENGVSEMFICGAAKIPEVASKNPVDIPKVADVILGLVPKSDQNVKQNLIDVNGTALGTILSGPLALVTAVPEIGFRMAWGAARTSVPIIDHEPRDGFWYGTISYTKTQTTTAKKEIQPSNSGDKITEGGHNNIDKTVMLSGFATLRGYSAMIQSSADEIYQSDYLVYGKVKCSMRKGFTNKSDGAYEVRTASGSVIAPTKSGVSLNDDYYTISIDPVPVRTTLTNHAESYSSGQCPGARGKPASVSFSRQETYSSEVISAKGKYDNDRNVLSGSDTQTDIKTIQTPTGEGTITTVTTITWNLKRGKK